VSLPSLLYSAAYGRRDRESGDPVYRYPYQPDRPDHHLKKEDDVVATLVFEGKLPAAGVIFFPSQPQAFLDSPFDKDMEMPASPGTPAKEREKTITLSGKLKSQPKPGKADRSGKPTAYADFAAHVEGEKDAHYYKATFHRHTRGIALKLPVEAQITVTGYPHPSNSARRTDTFSVMNIVDYPGKPPAKPRRRQPFPFH
jgi:hypothetical protein